MCLELPDGTTQTIAPADLATLPQAQVEDCYIVSTGHGASGPFRFSGVRLADFLHAYVPAGLAWSAVDVISGDGFGNRIYAQELTHNRAPTSRAILLATQVDGEPLARAAGLVRLIVPSETEDALRQVKWVARIVVHDV
ncbi:MAG: molybdopterin-dependent oxidoreductase [Litorilinea sp.]